MNLSRYKRSLEYYGIDEKKFQEVKDQLSKNFKKMASDNDVLWSLFNQVLAESQNDFHKLKMIYYEMALFLDEEGKDSSQMREESSKMQLLGLKHQGIEKVKILSARGCSNCKKHDRKIYIIDEALKKMPLPIKNCAHKLNNDKFGFCRCNWLPVIN